MSKRVRPIAFDCFANFAAKNSGHPMALLIPMAGRMTDGASIMTWKKGAGTIVLFIQLGCKMCAARRARIVIQEIHEKD
jgi:hypothetical protein